jgi:hypothetical protein
MTEMIPLPTVLATDAVNILTSYAEGTGSPTPVDLLTASWNVAGYAKSQLLAPAQPEVVPGTAPGASPPPGTPAPRQVEKDPKKALLLLKGWKPGTKAAIPWQLILDAVYQIVSTVIKG